MPNGQLDEARAPVTALRCLGAELTRAGDPAVRGAGVAFWRSVLQGFRETGSDYFNNLRECQMKLSIGNHFEGVTLLIQAKATDTLRIPALLRIPGRILQFAQSRTDLEGAKLEDIDDCLLVSRGTYCVSISQCKSSSHGFVKVNI